MAFSTSKIEKYVKKGVLRVLITMVDTAGNSDPFQLPDATHIAVQAQGTFGPGTVKIQVSNDGINFYDLPTAVSLAASGVKTVALADLGFLHWRVNLASGDGTTNVTVTIISRIRSAGTP